MAKLNCWEFMNCGKGPGGFKGPCIAALDKRLDKVNGGCNGGRSCWVVAGTLCGKKVQGDFASKLSSCLDCSFHMMVQNEEGSNFKLNLE